MQLLQLLRLRDARREERCLHRAPSHRGGITKILEHPKAGARKFLVKPLKDGVGKRGKLRLPSCRPYLLQHPGKPQSPPARA